MGVVWAALDGSVTFATISRASMVGTESVDAFVVSASCWPARSVSVPLFTMGLPLTIHCGFNVPLAKSSQNTNTWFALAGAAPASGAP